MPWYTEDTGPYIGQATSDAQYPKSTPGDECLICGRDRLLRPCACQELATSRPDYCEKVVLRAKTQGLLEGLLQKLGPGCLAPSAQRKFWGRVNE